MKFVIEAAGLTVAGGKELALDLMSRLAAHSEHHFVLVVPDLEDYKAISGGNIRSIVCKQGSGLLRRARLLNHEVPKICREERADALLCLGNFIPRKRVCPTAVLLQNAWIVYDDPVANSRRTLRERLVTAYGRHAYRHLRRDVTIITQTPVMRDHLCQRYGVPSAQVAIIPNALSLEKLGATPNRTPYGGHGTAEPFRFLCLAHCYAHKNIDILLDAAERLPKFSSRAAKCVITVAPGQHPGARRLLERLRQRGLEGKIENIGPVPSRMLPSVYQGADALIFPTLLESFSRTYLEALHFGLPILTSDRDFAHNLCQDAAVYFDPLDADSVARAMALVMEEADLRRRLVENGLRVLAQSPTWDEITARFVEVLERTTRAEVKEGVRQHAEGRGRGGVGIVESGVVDGRKADAGVRQESEINHQQNPSASYPLPTPEARPFYGDRPLTTADCLLPTAFCSLPSHPVRNLFNQKARGWRDKYGSRGTLNSRVEQFIARLAELYLPPARILDFGCGTGEIAAAMDKMGYRVTACDFAEEMLAVAYDNYSETGVEWVRLAPGWKTLPFADGTFDGIIASSVFEYLDDVPGVAEELFRVLKHRGALLLTVPNPINLVRQIEARLLAMAFVDHLPPLLRGLPRIEAYLAYLRLSRNRWQAETWHAIFREANLAAMDEIEFASEEWQRQSGASLVMLGVKKISTDRHGRGEIEAALCRQVAG
jgi:glycosyltransferase involved in cell wall biosynthesis/2-polyprenyl-3-methyl-5-hydroxy-6-metoxy-1,4-benzoquinol methylase